jgi:hypothetical protein
LKKEMLSVYDEFLFSSLPGGRPSYSRDQFREDFSQLMISDNKVANTILCQISNYFEGEGRELRERREVQVEHILPKKPARGGWWFTDAGFTLDEEEESYYKNYIPKIGNLTLLHQPLNGAAKNDPYDDKIRHYRDSDLKMTNTLPEDFDTWNGDNIEQRSRQLSEVAIEIWTLISNIEESREG